MEIVEVIVEEGFDNGNVHVRDKTSIYEENLGEGGNFDEGDVGEGRGFDEKEIRKGKDFDEGIHHEVVV